MSNFYPKCSDHTDREVYLESTYHKDISCQLQMYDRLLVIENNISKLTLINIGSKWMEPHISWNLFLYQLESSY